MTTTNETEFQQAVTALQEKLQAVFPTHYIRLVTHAPDPDGLIPSSATVYVDGVSAGSRLMAEGIVAAVTGTEEELWAAVTQELAHVLRARVLQQQDQLRCRFAKYKADARAEHEAKKLKTEAMLYGLWEDMVGSDALRIPPEPNDPPPEIFLQGIRRLLDA